ncbi:MAG: Ig-like domain-containing protein [Gammaproteobacteria bacterium]|nr:Ig-like domain-containing protein [Gammaproteobacteria bacterium]
MLTVSATPLMAPSLADLPARTLNVNNPTTIVFTNSGGSPQAGGCTAAPLPAGLMAALSGDGSSCQITGTPNAATTAAVAVTVTAVNAAGTGTAAIMLTVSASALMAPSRGNIARHTLATNVAVAGLVFANAGGAPQAGGCTATGLPAGLMVALSRNSGSCEITGMTSVAGSVTAMITAVNTAGNNVATAMLVFVDGPAPLIVPTTRPTLTLGATIAAADAIVISSGSRGLAFNGCSFLNDGEATTTLTLDGLSIETLNATSGGTGCRITGMLRPTSNPDATERTYVVRAGSVSSDGVFIATLTVDVTITAQGANPELPDTPIAAEAVTGVPLPTALLVRNTLAGANITACVFIDSNDQDVGVDSLVASVADAGRACSITGALTGTGTKTVNLRARSAGGQDDASIVFTFIPDPTPMLVADMTEFNIVSGVIFEMSAIRNTNSNSALILGSCQAVGRRGTVVTNRNPNEYRVGEISFYTDVGANACFVAGRPRPFAAPPFVGNTMLTVFATAGGYKSNEIVLTFTSRISLGLMFDEMIVNKKVGDAPFTILENVTVDGNPSTPTSRTDRTWLSSDTDVATVSAAGEVSIVGAGMTKITVSVARSRIGEGADASYMLNVVSFPPDLPESLRAAVADGVTLAQPLSVANAAGAADIAACAFINNSRVAVATLAGLTITKADDNRACLISGALTGAGAEQTFTVRATSASDEDDASIVFTVVAATEPALIAPAAEFDALLNTAIDTVVVRNLNSTAAVALAATNCVLVNEGGTALSSLTANGLTLATDVTNNACTIAGTPDTAGRNILRVRADKGSVMSNVVDLAFLVRNIDTPAFTDDDVTKKFGDAPFTNAIMAASAADSFTWSSSDAAVATVSTTGEVTILTDGETDITAVRAQSDTFAAATITYTLTVNPFPPNLPDRRIDFVAIDGTPTPDLLVVNASDGALIESCFFVVDDMETTAIDDLNIVADAEDGAGCVISGILNGAGVRELVVRARSASGADVADVFITVSPKPLNFASLVSASDAHTCAVSAEGELYCWGAGGNGRLGIGSTAESTAPARIGVATNWTQVGAGSAHTCAINDSGELYCWGNRNDGRIGLATGTGTALNPLQTGATQNWTQLSSGAEHSCAINDSNALYCWGKDDEGRVGDGRVPAPNITPTLVVLVGAPNSWAQVSAGNRHTCAVHSGGALYCWGQGNSGVLGLGVNDVAGRFTPTRVGTAANWAQVSAGNAHTCAVKNAGELFCWGFAGSGRLGLDDVDTAQLTPTQVGTAANWAQVSAGNAHTCAINTGAELFCWGEGDNGRLGLNSNTDKNIPTQVGSATNWTQVSAGNAHTCAVNTDYQLLCWGLGTNGRLGLDSTSSRSTPAATTNPDAATTSPLLASLVLTGPNAPARFNNGVFGAGNEIPALVFTNTGGDVQPSGCSIDTSNSGPDLPPGLRIHTAIQNNKVTCQITGTPTTATTMTSYAIIATNAIGSTIDEDPTTVSFQVDLVKPLLANIATAQTYTMSTTITALTFTNTGLDVKTAGCSINPTLPQGLSIAVATDSSKMTCQITGNPAATATKQTYTITATSANDNTDTAEVSIEVM